MDLCLCLVVFCLFQSLPAQPLQENHEYDIELTEDYYEDLSEDAETREAGESDYDCEAPYYDIEDYLEENYANKDIEAEVASDDEYPDEEVDEKFTDVSKEKIPECLRTTEEAELIDSEENLLKSALIQENVAMEETLEKHLIEREQYTLLLETMMTDLMNEDVLEELERDSRAAGMGSYLPLSNMAQSYDNVGPYYSWPAYNCEGYKNLESVRESTRIPVKQTVKAKGKVTIVGKFTDGQWNMPTTSFSSTGINTPMRFHEVSQNQVPKQEMVPLNNGVTKNNIVGQNLGPSRNKLKQNKAINQELGSRSNAVLQNTMFNQKLDQCNKAILDNEMSNQQRDPRNSAVLHNEMPNEELGSRNDIADVNVPFRGKVPASGKVTITAKFDHCGAVY